MARRKDGGDGIVVILAIGILIFPAMALCALIYFFIRCFFLPRRLSRPYVFPDDKSQEIEDVLSSISRANKKIEKIRAQGNDLELRADGLFDARNARGRRLNNALQPNYVLLDAATEYRELLEEEAERRVRKWNFNRTGRTASFVAIIVYLIAIIIAAGVNLPELAAIAIAGGAAGVVGGLTWLIKEMSAEEIARQVALYAESDKIEAATAAAYDGQDDDEPIDQTHASGQTERPPPRKQDCFEVLGVTPNASADEIKTAYRNAIKQYHPDYVANLGAELKEVAERKTKELNAAYQEAMGRRGSKVF